MLPKLWLVLHHHQCCTALWNLDGTLGMEGYMNNHPETINYICICYKNVIFEEKKCRDFLETQRAELNKNEVKSCNLWIKYFCNDGSNRNQQNKLLLSTVIYNIALLILSAITDMQVQVNNYEIDVNFFFISAITWHDIQQLSINLPEFTKFFQLMNWRNNTCKFV